MRARAAFLIVCCGLFWYASSACSGPVSSEPPASEVAQESVSDGSVAQETPPTQELPVPDVVADKSSVEPPVSQEPSPPDVAPDVVVPPEVSVEKPQDTVPTTCTLLPTQNIQNTWDWAQNTDPPGTGMMVYQNGVKLFEQYNLRNASLLIPSGGTTKREFSMYSMTKSLSGMAALLLIKQNKLTLQDKVSTYISEWRSDADKKDITIKELLSLSSGIKTEVKITNQIKLQDAINSPFVKKQFQYGSEPFTLFSYIIKQITSKDAETFLKEELFDKLGMALRIAKIKDGTDLPNLANGGFVTLPEIQKLAEELLAASLGKGKVFDANDIKLLTTPGLNPSYGLSVWLNDKGVDTSGKTIPPTYADCGPTRVFHMLGAGGQVVTIVPDKRLLVLKSAKVGKVEAQGRQDFWDKLFDQVKCTCQIP